MSAIGGEPTLIYFTEHRRSSQRVNGAVNCLSLPAAAIFDR